MMKPQQSTNGGQEVNDEDRLKIRLRYFWLIGDDSDNSVSEQGSDFIDGGSGNDEEYGGDYQAFADALAQNDNQSSVSGRGDWIDGWGGDDQLIGGAQDDVINGGLGADTILGGGGDDSIRGDTEVINVSSDWSAVRSIVTNGSGGSTYNTFYNHVDANFNPVGGGDDIIHAGAGKDWVFGEGGDDLIDAGTGNDVVFGDAGSDTLLGKEGDDVLIGDDSDNSVSEQGGDFIDGGEGNDELFGAGGSDALFGGAGDGRNMFHLKRILKLHQAGCYRSSCRVRAANTDWKIAA